MAEPTGVRYIGAGDYLPGVPARDLTADEWAALGADTQALALSLGLYIVATPPSAAQE